MATHSGDALYKCQFCPRSFNSNSNMYKHYRQKHNDEWLEAKEKRESQRTC